MSRRGVCLPTPRQVKHTKVKDESKWKYPISQGVSSSWGGLHWLRPFARLEARVAWCHDDICTRCVRVARVLLLLLLFCSADTPRQQSRMPARVVLLFWHKMKALIPSSAFLRSWSIRLSMVSLPYPSAVVDLCLSSGCDNPSENASSALSMAGVLFLCAGVLAGNKLSLLRNKC